MGRFLRIHWIFYCILIFAVSRGVMLYQYNLANAILAHQHSDFFAAMCKWDCKWYLTIIQDGYDLHPRTSPKIWKGLANWAFFPLYPYIVRYIALATGASAVVAGVLLNQTILLAALMMFYLYLKLSVDELNSLFGVILLAFSPFSIYFSSLYTEALFLLLSISAFYFMRTNRPFFAALCGGLLSATRPIGVMFSLAFAFYQLKTKKITVPSLLKLAILGILAISGLLIYMFYLQIHVGDFLAFQHIQKGWGRHGIDPDQFRKQLWQMINDTHNFILFMISFMLSIYLIGMKYYEEAMFNLLCILPGALTGTMMSGGRFCGTLFTMYFALVIMARKSHSFKLSLGLLSFLFYISYFMYWMAHATFLI